MKKVSRNALIQVRLTRAGQQYYERVVANKAYLTADPSFLDMSSTHPIKRAFHIAEMDRLNHNQYPQLRGQVVELTFEEFIGLFANEEFDLLGGRGRSPDNLIEDWFIMYDEDLEHCGPGGKNSGVLFELTTFEAEMLLDAIVAFEDDVGEDMSQVREIVEDAIDSQGSKC